MKAELDLNFDADYTTRAIASGISPVREYWTISQVEVQQALNELNISQEVMANDEVQL
jgi:hypothetical protein